MASLFAGAPRLSLSRHRSRQDSLRALPIATIEAWSPTHPTGQDPQQVPEQVALGERQPSSSSSASSRPPTSGWRMRTLPLPSTPDTAQQANHAQLAARLRGPMPGAQLPVATVLASANEQQQRQGRPRATAVSLAATALVFLPLLQIHTHGEHIARGLVAIVAYVAAAAGALSHAIASLAASVTAAYSPLSATPQLLATSGPSAEVALTSSASSSAGGGNRSSGSGSSAGGGGAGGNGISFVEGVRRAASRAFAAALLPLPYEVLARVSAAVATLLPLMMAGAASLVHAACGVARSWSAWRSACAASDAAAAAAAAAAAGPMHAGAVAAASSWSAAAAWACTALVYGMALLLPSPRLGGLTRGSLATMTGRKGAAGTSGLLLLTAARGALLWVACVSCGGAVEQGGAAWGAWLGAAWAAACAGVWGLHGVGLLASMASAVW